MIKGNYKLAKDFKKVIVSQPKINIQTPSMINPSYGIKMKYNTVNSDDRTKPEVWGPSFWFTLHNGSLNYPVSASKIISEKMKGFILGLPYMLPCPNCADHAKAYIDKNYSRLDTITNGRENLFNFYVDFHNYVNSRYGKKNMSYSEAKKLYTGSTISKMSY